MQTVPDTHAAVNRILWSRMRERLIGCFGHDCADYVADLRQEIGDGPAWRELCELCLVAEIPADMTLDAVSSM